MALAPSSHPFPETPEASASLAAALLDAPFDAPHAGAQADERAHAHEERKSDTAKCGIVRTRRKCTWKGGSPLLDIVFADAAALVSAAARAKPAAELVSAAAYAVGMSGGPSSVARGASPASRTTTPAPRPEPRGGVTYSVEAVMKNTSVPSSLEPHLSPSVRGRVHVTTLDCGDGTRLSLMMLAMRSGDALASLRIAPARGLPAVSARLGARGCRELARALRDAADEIFRLGAERDGRG